MRFWPLLIIVPLAVSGCDKRHSQTTTTTTAPDGTVTRVTTTGPLTGEAAVSGLDIDTDGFKAKLEIPGLTFGGDHMDIDGMKHYPGTKVRGVRVNATDRGSDEKGSVTMDFTSPATPAVVSTYMAEQARKAGYALTDVSTAGFTGIKREDDDSNRLTIALKADGVATSGLMTMAGSKVKS